MPRTDSLLPPSSRIFHPRPRAKVPQPLRPVQAFAVCFEPLNSTTQGPPMFESTAQSHRDGYLSFQESHEAREALWQRTLNDRRQREDFEEQMTSLFGSEWRDHRPAAGRPEAEAEARDVDGRWRPTADPRLARARRARVVAPHSSRFDRSPDVRSLQRGATQSHNDQVLRRHGALPVANTHAAGPRYNARLLRSVRDRRSPAARHALGLDGLGDRERSLSPEVWDTLFSTLTPDPQPPSAGSSFASVAASQSQSAGPSSSTPVSAPDIAEEELAPDAHCDDSGCEHSDVDMDEDEENMRFPRGPLSRNEHPGIPPFDPIHSNDRVPSAAYSHARMLRGDARPRPLSHSSIGDYSLANSMRNPRAQNAGENVARGYIPGFSRPPERWTMLVEASEEERGVEEERQNREAYAGAGQNAAVGGEEDWSGMQRIVRSLARREDIPDEWWAEAGLSRTLPQEETTNE
ncbi:hypothetical protein TOPH_07011 [Tolypocladium ophioglossoides CBS 100239]|uniref:Uncharacterized protein n=1 Tax=Tolypocladium ophioglossoides (strain CBS 100239) TaxID=1163406 RepID=A0A0L0N2T3_TOLOC|nr:hypothetical protein TOPH_07011 [Tolypocladium ophioglossoides CBS 100239]